MRRTLIAAGIALACTLTVAPVAASGASTLGAPGSSPASAPADPQDEQAAQVAEQALDTAIRVLEGEAAPEDPEPTMALLDLQEALPDLSGTERRAARALLARPTQGSNDPYGDGYTVPSTRKCNQRICVHYVRTTADAPPAGWVTTTLRQLNRVWNFEIRKMGYRKPLPDGKRGGDKRFDVYLKDLGGTSGVFGYCAADPRQGWTSSGYCVLDNDYTDPHYGGSPLANLRVTAAHEFFHAIQFAYDKSEDYWLMESTATWMEERFADAANANRAYLPAGQVRVPHKPLDTAQQDLEEYGNWAWWEYLTHRYHSGLVRQVWTRAAAGAQDVYSTKALRSVLAKRGGGFARNFAVYASINTAPGSWYPEGSAWPRAQLWNSHTLGGSSTMASGAPTVDHMASRNVAFVTSTTAGPGSKLQITVDGPPRRTAPQAVVLLTRESGKQKRYIVSLGPAGRGSVTVPFADATVARATLTLVNASTRFKCWQQQLASCKGIPHDDGQTFAYTATLLPG